MHISSFSVMTLSTGHTTAESFHVRLTVCYVKLCEVKKANCVSLIKKLEEAGFFEFGCSVT